MSLTFQEILNDAKKLSSKLKDHETCADSLVTQMQAVYNQVEAMKQYHDDISQLNDLASERPRIALIAGIQQENRNITDLQQENRELRVLIEEQQNAMDLIMTKYRLHISRLKHCDDLDKKIFESIEANTKNAENSTVQLNEMKLVMQKAIEIDDEAVVKEEELISRLRTENRGLREILQISEKYGSLPPPASSSSSSALKQTSQEDKEVQTESELL